MIVNTTEFFRTLKLNEDIESSLTLLVLGSNNRCIGSLRLIDRGRVNDPSLVINLTKWRNNAKSFFLTQFDATENRTQRWLESVVLPSEDRLLFEVLDATGRAIGHAGVFRFKDNSCELDNFIRGEQGGDPSLFLEAEVTMLNWLFCELGVSKVTLHVFSNNWIAIRNHLSIGFKVTGKYALSRKEEEGSVDFKVNGQDGEPVKFSYLEMSISYADFFQSGQISYD